MSKIAERLHRWQPEQWLRDSHWAGAMTAFAISNTIIFFGLFVFQIIDPTSAFEFSQYGIDIGIASVAIIWYEIIGSDLGRFLVIFGWTIAGIYAKRSYGKDSIEVLIRAAIIPIIFLFFTAGVIMLSFTFVPNTPGILTLFFIIFGLGFVLSVIFSFGGLILSLFISFNSKYSMDYTIEPDYLVLPVVPNGEKVSYCPFRSKTPGCSYLGYEAPDKPLICDYESSYLRCRVYSHIYYKLEEQDL